MTKKVFIAGYDLAVERMFRKQGWEIDQNLENISIVDLACFTGGEDVSPSLYGEENICSHSSASRDIRDSKLFMAFSQANVPMVGICRGGQFLNVMNGGKMWQDVNKHAISGVHDMLDEFTGAVYKVTSTHHQMMIEGEDSCIIGTSKLSTTKRNESGAHDVPKDERDNEILYYWETSSLCFQPHPENHNCPADTTNYFFELINDWIMPKHKKTTVPKEVVEAANYVH